MRLLKGYVVSDGVDEITDYDVYPKEADAIESGRDDFETATLYEVHYIPIKKVFYGQTRVEGLYKTKERK